MRHLVAGVLLVLLWAGPLAAADALAGPPGGPAAGPPASAPAAGAAACREYRAVRSVAVGLTTLGFLLGVAGMGLNAQRPEGYYQARKLASLCVLLFVLAVTDRIVVQGLAGWFGIPDSYVPSCWR